MLMVTSVSAGSPAESAGLQAGDQILEVEGVKATPKAINDLLTPSQPAGGRGGRAQAAQQSAQSVQPSVAVKKPGDRIKLRILRNGAAQDVDVELGKAVTRTYNLQPADNPSAPQAAILKDWLRSVQ
jgi:predicted metalloprotease with PDZ domain